MTKQELTTLAITLVLLIGTPLGYLGIQYWAVARDKATVTSFYPASRTELAAAMRIGYSCTYVKKEKRLGCYRKLARPEVD